MAKLIVMTDDGKDTTLNFDCNDIDTSKQLQRYELHRMVEVAIHLARELETGENTPNEEG